MAVKTAKNLGYQVVITDQHTPPKVNVEADAILNPRQADCNFPGKNLAGVGVAFYLAVGIRSYLQEQRSFNETRPLPNMTQFLDLVAIGTVADMVDLDDAKSHTCTELVSQPWQAKLTRGSRHLVPKYVGSFLVTP